LLFVLYNFFIIYLLRGFLVVGYVGYWLLRGSTSLLPQGLVQKLLENRTMQFKFLTTKSISVN